jgi:hypothetical protein
LPCRGETPSPAVALGRKPILPRVDSVHRALASLLDVYSSARHRTGRAKGFADGKELERLRRATEPFRDARKLLADVRDERYDVRPHDSYFVCLAAPNTSLMLQAWGCRSVGMGTLSS